MKKPYLDDLRQHILGTITDNTMVRSSLQSDASGLTAQPEGVAYPANTADVRKIVGFAAEQAEAGRQLSIVPRGLGGGRSGGAVGGGLQLVMSAAMNRILRLDSRSVTVQAGLSYAALQQTLQTHGRCIASAPDALHSATVGGAVAENASGIHAVKYGATRQTLTSLKAVLADGSLIKTGRLGGKQLGKVLGQDDFEGHVYRGIDALLQRHHAVIHSHTPQVAVDSSRYALAQVRGHDGSLDLGQLIIGSEGSLAVITEATLQTSSWNPRTTLVVGYLPNIEAAAKALPKLLEGRPSALEFVDGSLLQAVLQHDPQAIHDVLPAELPGVVLLVQFDDLSQLAQTMKARRAAKVLVAGGNTVRVATDPVEQEALWRLGSSAQRLALQAPGASTPVLEDGIVPVQRWGDFVRSLRQLLAEHDVLAGMWGSAGVGIVRVHPQLETQRKKDGERLALFVQDYVKLVKKFGGSISASLGDGKLRSPLLPLAYSKEMAQLDAEVKQLFDPQGIFNPGSVVSTSSIETDTFHAAALMPLDPYHPFR